MVEPGAVGRCDLNFVSWLPRASSDRPQGHTHLSFRLPSAAGAEISWSVVWGRRVEFDPGKGVCVRPRKTKESFGEGRGLAHAPALASAPLHLLTASKSLTLPGTLCLSNHEENLRLPSKQELQKPQNIRRAQPSEVSRGASLLSATALHWTLALPGWRSVSPREVKMMPH